MQRRNLIRMAAALSVALAMPIGANAADGKLVVYTSQPSKDAQATVDAFNKLHPNVEVEWIRDGTTKVMAKLRAEFAAGAPKPDVLLIADVVNMESLKADGKLMAYADAPVSAYGAELYDAGKTYFSTKLITSGIVYNTGAPMKPKTWADLVRPEAKGLVAMPSPLTSGAATVHMATLTAHPDLGWKYYELLAANGVVPKGGNGGTFKAVASGECLVEKCSIAYDRRSMFPQLRLPGLVLESVDYFSSGYLVFRVHSKQTLFRPWRTLLLRSATTKR